MTKKSIFLLFFFISHSICSQVQKLQASQSFVNFSVNQGLPSSEVYDLYQDPKKGIMWIATDRGLVKYDGYSFQTFTVNDGLTDNVIFKLTPDRFGNIWCHTMNNKLCYIDPEQRIKTYKYNKQLGKISFNKDLRTICLHYDVDKKLKLTPLLFGGQITVDQKGKTRIKDFSDGKSKKQYLVNFLPDKSFYFFSTEPKTTYCYPINDLRFGTIHKINTNFFLVSDGNKISIYKGKKLQKTIYAKSSTMESGRLSDSTFWVSYLSGGIDFFDLKGNLLQHNLDQEIVSDIQVDHEGGIWFSTISNGIFYLKNVSLKTIGFNDRLTSASSNGSHILLGFYDGSLGKLNSKTLGYEAFKGFNIFPVYVEAKTKEKKYYMSYGRNTAETDFNLKNVVFYPKGTTKINEGNVDSTVFFASYIGFFKKEANSLELKHENKTVSFRTSDLATVGKEIFVSTYKGLYKYTNRGAKKIYNSALDFRITDIDPFKKGLICASLGGGCVYYASDTLLVIKKQNGLLSDLGTEVFVENDSTVWFATTSGVNKIVFTKRLNYRIYGFTIAEGLIGNEVIDIDTADNKIWIVSKKGLSFIPKNHKLNQSVSKLFFSLEKILINGKMTAIRTIQKIALAHDENDLEVFFKAISFSRNAALTYRYKLYPGEKQWRSTKSRSVVFTALPPGKYQLKLQATIDNIHWSDEVALSISISSPFWQTFWFLAIVSLVVLTILYALFRARLNKQKGRVKLLETEMKALRAQMNPHFIFNALSSIQNFILKGNIPDSNKYLVKFSRLIRGVLENSKTELVLLKTDLEILQLYVELEQIRVKEFDFEILVDEDLITDSYQIPPLLLQPFVENAIWHGFKFESDEPNRKGKLTIKLKKEDQKLICIVDDNGVGRKPIENVATLPEKKHHSMGIEITRERVKNLKKVYHIDTEIKIVDKLDEHMQPIGTTIVLVLPLIRKT